MDKRHLDLPICVWTQPPHHEITCMTAAAGEPGSIVTGSDTGELCLWRVEQDEFENTGGRRIRPMAIVVGRKTAVAAVTALSSLSVRDISFFIAGYSDGMISAHYSDSGDSFACAHVLPEKSFPTKLHIFQAKPGDPFVEVFCVCSVHHNFTRTASDIEIEKGLKTSEKEIEGDPGLASTLKNQEAESSELPLPMSSRIYLVRVGLMDSYRGMVSLVTSFDMNSPMSPRSGHVTPFLSQGQGSDLSVFYSSAIFSPKRHPGIILLLTLSSDHVIRSWDFRNMTPTELLKLEPEGLTRESLLEIEISTDERFLLLLTDLRCLLYTIHFFKSPSSNPESNANPYELNLKYMTEVAIPHSNDALDGALDGVKFISDCHFLIWRQLGPLYLHQISSKNDSESLTCEFVSKLILPENMHTVSSICDATLPLRIIDFVQPSPGSSQMHLVQASGFNLPSGGIAEWTLSDYCDSFEQTQKNQRHYYIGTVSSINQSFGFSDHEYRHLTPYGTLRNLGRQSSLNHLSDDHTDVDLVTCCHTFDTGNGELLLCVALCDGEIRCCTIGGVGGVRSIKPTSSAVTSLKGIPSEHVKGMNSAIRPSILFAGTAGGHVVAIRVDLFTVLSVFSNHARPITSLDYLINKGEGDEPHTENLVALCEDNAFSVYEIAIHDKDSTVALISFNSTMFCPGHDSAVVSVLRNAWSVSADYIISVTLTGHVYFWVGMTGHLDRVLCPTDGKKLLKERKLFMSDVGQVRVANFSSTLIDPNLAPDAYEIVSRLSYISSDKLLRLNKYRRDSVFGTLSGLNRGLNLMCFAIDIQNLINMHCLTSTDLTIGNEAESRESLDHIPEMPEIIHSEKTSPVITGESELSPSNSNRKSVSDSSQEKSNAKFLTLGFRRNRSKQKLSRRSISSLLRRVSGSNKEDTAEIRKYSDSEFLVEVNKDCKHDLRCALSYLLDWNLGAEDCMEEDLKKLLAIYDPSDFLSGLTNHVSVTFGVFGSVPYGANEPLSMTILLPKRTSPGNARKNGMFRWRFSNRFSAIHSLSLNAICIALMSTGAVVQQALFSRLVSYYSTVLAVNLPLYVEASLLILGYYGLHECEGINIAARLLLQGIIERLDFDRRRAAFDIWSKFYLKACISNTPSSINADLSEMLYERLGDKSSALKPKVLHASESEGDVDDISEFGFLVLLDLSPLDQQTISLLILSLLILQYPDDFDSKMSKVICTHLIGIVCEMKTASRDGLIRTSLAADLVGKGILLWKEFAPNINSLIQSLLKMSIDQEFEEASILRSSVDRTLLQLAQATPNRFISVIGSEALKASATPDERASAILKVVSVIKKYPFALFHVLPRVVETITRCLDPAEPSIRRALLKPCTSALHALTKAYPMVAFHQISQLFAVGTSRANDKFQKCVILIYDLRTATKWRIIEGHSHDITAIEFSEDGTTIASYSSFEQPNPSLRLWKTGSQGIFSSLLGTHGRCFKIIHLHPSALDPDDSSLDEKILQHVKIVWKSPSRINLTREDGTSATYSF